MKGAVISVLVVLAIVQMAMPGEAVDCGEVTRSIVTCIPFLTGADSAPSASCCSGVANLKTLAPTTADRRAACECVKAAAVHYPIKDDAASSLPKKCDVDINIPISKTTNCQAIN